MSVKALESREAGLRSRVGRRYGRAPLVFLLALTVVALLPASPLLYKTPNNDSSIFLYISREMLEGKLLYRDVFDHKPPLIFLINAAGLLLGGKGLWGVWFLELLSLTAALVLAYLFLERFFGRLPALVACAAWLANLAFVHERGNLTEEYAYPFQFAALFLLAGVQNIRRSAWRFLAMGVLLGLAASLKQPLAGIGLSMAVFLAFETFTRPGSRPRDLLLALLWMALGAAAVWLAWLAGSAAAGVFPEFWEAVFLMNFGVSGHSTPERLRTLGEAFGWLAGSSGFFLGGMLIWLTVVPFLILEDSRVLPVLSGRWAGAGLAVLGLLALYNGFFRAGLEPYAFSALSAYRLGLIAAGAVLVGLGGLVLSGWAARAVRRWLAAVVPTERSNLALPLVVALVDLPLSLGFAALTGRNFPHYFMPLAPSLVILFAYGVHLLFQAAGSPARRLQAWAWLAALLLPVFAPGIWMTARQLQPRSDRQVEDVAAYLEANTRPGETVLQWGIAPAVYILSGRDAPTRFFFANPLFFDGYSGEWHTTRLLADLRDRPPALIVDALMVRLPLVTAPGWQDCDQVLDPAYYQSFLETRQAPGETIPRFPPGMGEVYRWICQNYQPAGPVGELNWQVYRLKGK
jgi:4-amino-4-deoxy-L-arabinose transferase-like glycosyltransferase